MHKLSIYCFFATFYVLLTIFSTSGLVAQEHSHIRCGTFSEQTRQQKPHGSDELNVARPVLSERAFFADSSLCVHYAATGTDAPSLVDADANGIPDYIDAVGEHALFSLNFFADTLGFLPIPSDNDGGGTKGFDIYVVEQGPSGIYGATYRDKQISAGGGQQGRYSTFVVIDNNYSELDSTGFGALRRPSWYTSGNDALKVTVAHELHHAVQIGAYGDCPSQCAFHEMTSTWIEQRLFPDVFDWEQHVPAVLRDPLTMNIADANACVSGYRMGLFNQYLMFTSQDDVFEKTWSFILNNDAMPFASLVTTTQQYGGLSSLLCDFYPFLYKTGARAYANPMWEHASDYAAVELTSDDEYAGSPISHEFAVPSLGVSFHRIVVPAQEAQTTDDTLVLVVSSTTEAVSGSQPDARFHLFVGSDFDADHIFPIGNSGKSAFVTELSGSICIGTIEGVGAGFDTPQAAFPQPFEIHKHEVLYLPVPNSMPGNTAHFTLMNSALESSVSGSASTIVRDGKHVVPVVLDRSTPSGVYIWQTSNNNGESLVGKLAIVQ